MKDLIAPPRPSCALTQPTFIHSRAILVFRLHLSHTAPQRHTRLHVYNHMFSEKSTIITASKKEVTMEGREKQETPTRRAEVGKERKEERWRKGEEGKERRGRKGEEGRALREHFQCWRKVSGVIGMKKEQVSARLLRPSASSSRLTFGWDKGSTHCYQGGKTRLGRRVLGLGHRVFGECTWKNDGAGSLTTCAFTVHPARRCLGSFSLFARSWSPCSTS